MKSRRLLVARIALALVAPSVAFGAEIAGSVRNGTVPNGVVAGHDVRLTATAPDGERIDEHASTDARGAFAFTGVPADTSVVYVLSTLYEDVEIASRFLQFPAGADRLEEDLVVYEVSRSDSALELRGRHLVLEMSPGAESAFVTEVVALGNEGTYAVHGDVPFGLSVPPGAFAPEALEGFATAAIEGEEIVLSLGGAIRPGRFAFEGAFRYQLPAAFPLAVTFAQRRTVDEMSILVSPVGSDVRGDGLESVGVVDLGDGVVCDRYRIPVPGVGRRVSIVVEKIGSPHVHRPLPGADGPSPWLLVGGLLLGAAGVLLAREGGTGPRRPAPEAQRLLAQRDRVLEEILAFEQASVGGDDAAAKREKLLAKATALQELIDEMSGRDA